MQLASKPFNSIFEDTHANKTSRTQGQVGLHAMLIRKGKLVNNSQKWLQSTEEIRQLASRIRMSGRDCWDKLLLCLYLPPRVINLRLLLLQ